MQDLTPMLPYAKLTDDELARYHADYVNERGELMGFAQFYRSKGWQEGQREGWQAGRQVGIPQGEAQILRRLLTRRFGPLPVWAEAKLAQATTDTLELWADRILDAASLDEVFRA